LIKYKPLREDSILPWEEGFILESEDKILPNISIVIPIFNSGEFLEKTLRSLLCNDLNGVELILMDGGSTDETMKIVKYYEKIFSYIQSEKDKGQSDAINKGFKHATGQIYYWLNGDDIILPNTLNKVRQYFKDNSSCHVLVGNAYMTERNFSPINHFVFSPEKLNFSYLLDYAKNHLIQPSVFFSRDAWISQGSLDVDNHYSMDADLFIGLSKKYDFHKNIDEDDDNEKAYDSDDKDNNKKTESNIDTEYNDINPKNNKKIKVKITNKNNVESDKNKNINELFNSFSLFSNK
jgi:glycosyltransferase involved in cell wall biosynthesis